MRHHSHPDPREAFSRRVDRRVVLKAAAAFTAMSIVGVDRSRRATAQGGGTLAGTWVETENVGAFSAAGDALSFQADFPFFAIAPHWSGETGFPALVEMSLSTDGVSFSEPFVVGEAATDAGPPDREGRHFGQLVAVGGASFVRYRGLDANGNLAQIPGLAFTYIDATGGPTIDDVYAAALTPSIDPPPIISRSQWGAALAYGGSDQAASYWPPSYQTVEHVIIHHTATPNFRDPLTEIRSIHYYHAITRGWGDIGYNYLVDFMGNVYEGRVGGDNVIGGHSFQYARGSSGIGTMGDFSFQNATPEAQAGVIWITAWAGRNLNPLGSKPFHDIPNLPTICAHRDVNPTACPGDAFYGSLPAIRQAVADVLGGDVQPGPEGEYAPGDVVETVVIGGNLRSGPGTNNSIIASMDLGTVLTIVEGPTTTGGYSWYRVSGPYGTGWAASIIFASSSNEPPPPPPPPAGQFSVGDVVQVSTDALNLRSAPGTAAGIIATMPNGTQGEVVGGPEEASGYTWYQLQTSYGTGWSADAFLELATGTPPPPPPPPPSGQFQIGDAVVVSTNALNLRSNPGTNSSIITTMPNGTPGDVIDGPQAATGYTWYQLQTNLGTGWSAEDYLSLAGSSPPPPPPPSGQFSIGDSVSVSNGPLNLRSSPGTSAGIIATMPTGTQGQIVDGPQSANGYTWYQLQTSYGTGWSADAFLTLSSGGGGGIAVGDTVQVVDGALNLRTGPSTSNPVIAVMPDGTQLSVIGGPASGSGYNWFQVSSATYGTGWCVAAYLASV